jgi:hypothetical protein
MVMGSPLAPAVSKYFIEDFEHHILNMGPQKTSCWYWYVDDMLIIWPHTMEEFQEFQQHLNSIHKNIMFTTEIETNWYYYLVILVTKNPDGSLGHSIHRKRTRSNTYLHAESHQCCLHSLNVPRQCMTKCFSDEIQHLRKIFWQNGYNAAAFNRAINMKHKKTNRKRESLGVASLHFNSQHHTRSAGY